MRENTIERYSILMLDVEALLDQVPGLVRQTQFGVPDQLPGADLLVCGVGDVPAQHVVEQDAQGPDSQTRGLVFSVQDPLRWAVDTSTTELFEHFIWIFLVIMLTPGTEVYQLGVVSVEVHEDVFVLDVSVEDAAVSAVDDSGDNLTEHVSGKIFRERPVLGYKIEQVLAMYFLHDNVITICVVNIVQDLDHALHVLNLLHKSHFSGNVSLILIIILISIVFYHFFNRHLESVRDPDTTENSAKTSLAKHLLQFILRLQVSSDHTV